MAYKDEIYRALQSVERGGDFCGGGTFERFLFQASACRTLGPNALPLLPAQAEELKKKCALAPFGKKEQTVYDKGRARHVAAGALAAHAEQPSGAPS